MARPRQTFSRHQDGDELVMSATGMHQGLTIDSYRWLPRSLAGLYQEWPMKRIEPVPFTPVSRPLSEIKLGLVTTAGVYVEGQDEGFDVDRERREPTWGDPSYREIPRSVERRGIGASHLHVNNDPVRRDLNVVLPLDHAESAVAVGQLGALADTHYSLLGYQLDMTTWETETAPRVAEGLVSQAVDAAVITPYCPDCCRTVALLARAIEAAGVASVVVTMMPVYAERLGLPRTLGVEHPYGQPVGPAENRERQREVFGAALEVLEQASRPGYIAESMWDWPDAREARKAWHPSEPSPIAASMVAGESWVPPWELATKSDA
jgi:D-proline reductase (dithiol) PrdB